MIQRGSIHWADLGEPRRSEPGWRRPIVVIQIDRYTESRLATVLAAIVTGNERLGAVPGNVVIEPHDSGLPRTSVINVTALVAVDKAFIEPAIGLLPLAVMQQVDDGLRFVLGL
ncbi:type II toxin-antitoxin system PemK/MazF family toxin [Blastococcus saxobsidens]|uniref:mRNA interferase n=1 Tax=Blastococcus saxobsidens (strain DD2) TaxID=1146883 RepID=H6RM55_BLASD|nr:type II toxin-antitoxin system PemK/MazF family toxin [Blastococcus saxobsidens]CCG01297.1 Toxin of TAS system, PemK-like protein [Blastococcus saxobsidens DD2]